VLAEHKTKHQDQLQTTRASKDGTKPGEVESEGNKGTTSVIHFILFYFMYFL
jgi:hypothetical protein